MNKKIFSTAKIVVLTVFLIFFDQFTKFISTLYLEGQNDIILIKDVLRLHYLDGGNTGAAWGMLSGKITMFIIFTVTAIALIGIILSNIQRFLLEITDKARIIYLKCLNFAFILLLSGAIGNLIDRIIHKYVIDFIYFELIDFPIFNIADCYVTIGCIIIIFVCFFKLEENDFARIFSFRKK